MKGLLEKVENNLKLNIIDSILNDISLARKPEDDLAMHVVDMFKVLKKGFTKQEEIALVKNYHEIEKLFNPKNIIADPLGGVKLRDSAMKVFHSKYSKILGADLATAVGTRANDVVEAMYLASQKSIARKAKLAPVTLSLKDKSTMKVLGQQNTFWIKSHYSRTLSWRINNIGKEVVSLGLDTKSASAVFKERLGTQFKYTDAYWNVLGSNVLNRSKNYSQVNFYTRFKVKTLEIVNPMDERTTPQCFPPWASVLMADGSQKRICNLQPGEKVITGGGKRENIVEVLVRNCVKWIRLQFQNKGVLFVTPEHKIYTLRGWVQAKNLREKDDYTWKEEIHLPSMQEKIPCLAQRRRQSKKILFHEMLPEGSNKEQVGQENLPQLPQKILGQKVLCGKGPISVLQHKMQKRSSKEGTFGGVPYKKVFPLWKGFQNKTSRSIKQQKQEVLLQNLSKGLLQKKGFLSSLREKIRSTKVGPSYTSILLSELLSKKQSRNSSRNCSERDFEGTQNSLSTGSKVRTLQPRFSITKIEDSDRGRRRVLAWQEEEKHQEESGTDLQGRFQTFSDRSQDFGRRLPEEVSTELPSIYSHPNYCPTRVVSVKEVYFPEAAYNLEVEGNHTYHVNGILVHNCRDMNGRVFTVKSAVKVMENALGASPKDFMDIQPWLGWDSKRKQSFYTRGGIKSFLPSGRTASDNAVFERRGIELPPFHGLCRTTTVFSEFET